MTAPRTLRRTAILIGLLVTTSSAAAPVSIESVRIGFANKNSYKVGTWTPVRLLVKADRSGFNGTIAVSTLDDSGTPVSVRQPVSIGADQTQRVTTYVRPGGRDPGLSATFFDQEGKRVATFGFSGLVSYDVISVEETVLLTLGRPLGVDLIPSLVGYSADPSANTKSIVVEPIDLSDEQLPSRWYGYDAAEAVVLDTNSRDSMEALKNRGKALRDWVERGGHLVLNVGSNWQEVVDANSELREMLPAAPTGLSRINDLGVLEVFAGSSNPIVPGSASTVGLQVAKLGDVEKRGGKVLAATSSLPLIVRGSFGFGRVTLIAFDVDQNPFGSWTDRALFWDKTLDLKRVVNSGTNVGINRTAGRFTNSGNTDLAGILRRSLEQFPGIKLVPFGWVAFAIFLYILLIGPGDYFFLKKVLKRMEFTWITFPIIVTVVSLGAYYASYAFKGTELRINKVDALDIDQKNGLMRGRTFTNIFSPQNRDYSVSFKPLVPGTQTPSPDLTTESVVGWFSSPEVAFGAMGGGGRIGFAGSGYGYEPSKLDSLNDVRIPIWSTKCFTSRWFGPAENVIESEIEAVGVDQINGTLINRIGRPITNAVLFTGARVYDLGTLAPGASVRVELSPDRTIAGYLKSLNMTAQASFNNNSVDRINLLKTLMFNDAVGVGNEQLTNTCLDDMDLSGQLTLDRPMLVGKIDGPAAELNLKGTTAEAKIDQTTVVRIILQFNDDKVGK